MVRVSLTLSDRFDHNRSNVPIILLASDSDRALGVNRVNLSYYEIFYVIDYYLKVKSWNL